MMNRTELQFALRPLHFLNTHADLPEGLLEVRPGRMLVWDHDTVAGIFQADRQLAHPGSRSLNPLLGHKSVLWADGERHLAYRRVLGAPLQGRRLARYHETITETVHTAIDRLTPGTEFQLADWTRQVTLNIVAQIILGHTDSEILGEFTAWLNHALGSRRRTLLYRYLRGGLPLSGQRLDRRLVASAKAASDKESLVSLMLAPGSPLRDIDDGELRDQIVSLLFAGHETTASATAWTVYSLVRNAGLRHDVQSELDTSGGDGTDESGVPLLQAVIQETLRLWPPAEVAGSRRPAEDTELSGRLCPAGTVLTPAIYLAHHRAEYFPDPYRFRPERFLGKRTVPEGYFPFGGGTRYCLGRQLGQLEIRMITSALLRRRELVCVNPRAGVLELRGHAMAPSAKLTMKVTACRD